MSFKFCWKISLTDLRHAVLSLLLDDEIKNDETVLKLVELIKVQFENDQEMFVWTKDIFQKVSF